jgi:hypothetical protein
LMFRGRDPQIAFGVVTGRTVGAVLSHEAAPSSVSLTVFFK